MNRNRKGFTLVELLMVVIIIGILISIAIPNYFKTIERTKGGSAKAVLDSVRKAELQYRAMYGNFADVAVGDWAAGDISAFDYPEVLATAAGDDGNWIYTVQNSTADVFEAVATRGANAPTAYQGVTMILDQDGLFSSENPVHL
ncbi:MAG: prepilin-type N-terminal cleavage/methylation domain-containing protein [Candidatus Omnitrophica bacterium]|nr:prepilin-type N-terminal cleavage/methylation domain-containing protein [Candidatus Omnitrophota bacterium]